MAKEHRGMDGIMDSVELRIQEERALDEEVVDATSQFRALGGKIMGYEQALQTSCDLNNILTNQLAGTKQLIQDSVDKNRMHSELSAELIASNRKLRRTHQAGIAYYNGREKACSNCFSTLEGLKAVHIGTPSVPVTAPALAATAPPLRTAATAPALLGHGFPTTMPTAVQARPVHTAAAIPVHAAPVIIGVPLPSSGTGQRRLRSAPVPAGTQAVPLVCNLVQLNSPPNPVVSSSSGPALYGGQLGSSGTAPARTPAFLASSFSPSMTANPSAAAAAAAAIPLTPAAAAAVSSPSPSPSGTPRATNSGHTSGSEDSDVVMGTKSPSVGV